MQDLRVRSVEPLRKDCSHGDSTISLRFIVSKNVERQLDMVMTLTYPYLGKRGDDKACQAKLAKLETLNDVFHAYAYDG